MTNSVLVVKHCKDDAGREVTASRPAHFLDQPIRIRRQRSKGWRMPANTISVARPGRWGNPFVVGVSGDARQCCCKYAACLDAAIAGDWQQLPEELKCEALELRPNANEFFRLRASELTLIRGSNLACYCKEEDPCHADTLLLRANA